MIKGGSIEIFGRKLTPHAQGPLPLLTPLLYVSVLVELAMVAMAWEKRTIFDHMDGTVFKRGWRLTQTISFVLYAAFASGSSS